ncbi:MAG: hypothetical protein L7U64_05290 [Luminiphilus sp.]|nr:hypothetical protein [Luminiphilus sp.]
MVQLIRNATEILVISIALAGCAIDKQKHFVAGAVASSWVYEETGDRSKACLAALGVGLAKELVDDRNGRADRDDAAATTVGCTAIYFFD